MNDASGDKTSGRVAGAIVIVDDEEIVTQSLMSFLQLETEYEVHTFQSPEEALQLLRQRPIDLVISDFLMPGMNGLQFLAAVKKLHPDTPRILLTGYADKENAIRAINEVGLFQYVEKPWDIDQLKLVIDNAITSRSRQELLREKIDELDDVLRQRNELFERDSVMKRELRMAAMVQKKLLPSSLPQTAAIAFDVFYQPAMEVGGDFYDVIDLGEKRLALLLADVMGHGIQAALSTALLKFAFGSFTGSGATPAGILAGMNSMLRTGLPTGSFVAAAVATIDTGTRRCTVANGGLPHPYVLCGSTGRAELVAGEGLLLGFAGEELYQPGEETTVTLDFGDSLIIYTDGLSEAQNPEGDRYGETALSEQLTALPGLESDIGPATALGEMVRQFAAGAVDDDVTIVAVTAR